MLANSHINTTEFYQLLLKITYIYVKFYNTIVNCLASTTAHAPSRHLWLRPNSILDYKFTSPSHREVVQRPFEIYTEQINSEIPPPKNYYGVF